MIASHTRNRLRRVATPALICLLTGCSAPAPVAHEQLEHNPRFATLEVLSPAGPLAGDDLYPFTPGEWVQQIVYADRIGSPGRQIVHHGSLTDEHGAEFAYAMGDARTEFWARDEQGNLVMPATLEHKKQALSVFDPPLLIAYAELPPGERRQTQAKMRVLSSTDPSRQREAGRAVRSIEYVHDERIATPLGEFLAKRIEVRFTADLTFADADKYGTYWVVPGLGVVAQAHEEEIRILGVISEQNRRSLVLLQPPHPQ